ncbi:restriction modification system DNA specificity domain [Candidatus Moduliflexus flocculans]|uniref:Restriction modification system DNA specificity domain n=1 Tax=Candidatus Moduliflexus flocculans TaxID=1499966 RepID=A0A0S6W5A5_9BACT|nr:restriction modification system DNA specificity domain [Candidatus Moduliflexus flocculans]
MILFPESLPPDKQPHPVPENWVWVKLKELLQKVEKIDPIKAKIGEFTYLDISSIDNLSYQITEPKIYQDSEAPSRAQQVVQTGDILFSTVRPYLKNIAMVDAMYDKQIASTGFYVMRSNHTIEKKLLFYFVISNEFINRLCEFQRGISYPAVKTSTVLDQPVPLPPLPEQRRIAAKLNALIGKLREARTLIDEARESFALRRAAILHQAFSGKLTAAWRAEHPDVESVERLLERVISKKRELSKTDKKVKVPTLENMMIEYDGDAHVPDTWKWVHFKDICKAIKDGTHFSPQEQFNEDGEGRFLYLSSKNIRDYGMALDDVTYVNEEVHREIYQRCDPEFHDVLLVKDGAKTGTVTLNTLHQEFSLLSSVAVLKVFESTLEASFLKYFIQSPIGQQHILGKLAGSAITRITLEKINRFFLPIPPLEEQREIVRQLESLLGHETDAAGLLDMDDELDLLEQSILSRAFRGELGTNDPAESPAL